MRAHPKTILAGLAAVATLLSGMAITGPAMAADTRVNDTDLAMNQPLTVSANEDISGRMLKAVPLAYYSYAQTDGTNITGFDLIDAGKANAIDAAITAANVKNKTNESGYDVSNPMVWVVQHLLENNANNAGNLRDFLDKLKNNAAITGDTTATTLSTVKNDNTKQTATVRPGVYAVVDTTATGQASIVMFNGTGINGKTTLKKADDTTYTLGEVSYKVHETTVTKKITTAESGTVATGGTSAETAIGKTVSFEMTSKVPNWTGYDKYYYAINDTYSKGLTFDAATANVQVKVGETTLTKDTDYKITTGTDASGNATFTILFAPTTGDTETSSDIVKMKDKFPVGAAVKVTYQMTVNKNAAAGTADTNVNEVEYSHNPNTVTDHEKTPGQTTKVYVGKFTITKHDTNNQPLAGAEFKVYEDGQNDPVKFVKSDDGFTYRKADLTETTGTTDTITSTDQNNGVITLTGLDGKYKVVETKSPFNGSILPTFTLTLKVNQTEGSSAGNSSLSVFGKDTNNLASENTDKQGVTVVNARNLLDMPKTGVTWLCIFGAMTVLLAGGAFLLLRKGKDSDRA